RGVGPKRRVPLANNCSANVGLLPRGNGLPLPRGPPDRVETTSPVKYGSTSPESSRVLQARTPRDAPWSILRIDPLEGKAMRTVFRLVTIASAAIALLALGAAPAFATS